MFSTNSFGHKAIVAIMAMTATLCGTYVSYAAVSPVTAPVEQSSVNGTVVDANGQPVIGAAVVVKGTNTGTTTDVDGKFALPVAAGKTLEVSCIGYVTKTVAASSNMMIVLDEDSTLLEETVVIGYGSVKKSNLTSAVASMDNSSIDDRPMARAEQALQGQLAGVNVTITNNEPGADPQIRVRGSASINGGNNPLYVIDGVPQTTLQGINPNDIANIEVLKDAASAAIYGSRGSNGVIIVTTKHGEKGKAKVNFTASVGVATLEKKMDVLSATEWMTLFVRECDANYLALYPSGSISDSNAVRNANLKYKSFNSGAITRVEFDDRWFQYLSPEMQASHTYDKTKGELSILDWQDEFYKPAVTQNYNVSVSGASDNTKYMFSMGYMDQNGLSPSTNYKRINLRTNIETKISKLFTVGLNLAPTYTMSNNYGRSNGKDSMTHVVLSAAPVSEPGVGYRTNYYPNSQYLWAGSTCAPIQQLEDNINKGNNFRFQGSTFLRFTPFDGFQVEATASANFRNQDSHTFTNGTYQKGAWKTKAEGEASTASHSTAHTWNTLLQVVANYNKTIKKHDFGAMLGASSEVNGIGFSTSQSFKNLANDTITGTFSGSSTTTTPTVSGSSISESTPTKLLSVFGRLNYSYASKYMLTASLRYDGYSLFGKDSKWGLFPSVSAGWMVSSEPFFKNMGAQWWNTFKLRASYGQTGNNGVSSTGAYSTLSSTDYADDLAYIIGAVGNANLGWEKTHSTDIAADFGFLNNRIQVSLDWYTKTTTDLLYSIPVPSTTGMTSTTGNSGSIYNTGIELELNTRNIEKKDFSWGTSFNMSYNKNKVLQLGTTNTRVESTDNGATNVLEVGMPMYYFYGYKCLGVWKSQAEIDEYTKETGLTPKYNGANIKPGDLRHEDINGDGNITTADRQYLGKPTADFTFGMTNKFRWKNFDASVLFTAQTGGMIFGTLGRAIDRAQMGAQTNAMGWWRDAWWSEDEPGNGWVPYFRSSVKPDADSRFLWKSDYFRIKNITIGYTIPFKKVINSARAYLSIENLLILDEYYHGYTPESSNRGKGGIDYGGYPSARTFTLGVNVNF